MPRSTQIVPQYEVPHVYTVINDNSVITESAPVVSENGVRFLCVFPSTKGQDRVIQSFNSTKDFVDEYGYPNFELFGQASLMPWALLSTGNAKVYCERIMPDDAEYANLVIVAKVPKTPTDSLNVKFEATYITGVRDDMAFRTMVDGLKDLETGDTEIYPIVGIRCKGRGTYGNAIRFRITGDTASDKDNNFKNYIVEIFDSGDGTLVRKNAYAASLFENAVAGTKSLFLTDVAEDDDHAKVEIYANALNLKTLYNKYAALATTPVPYNEFDFFYGKTKSGSSIEKYTVDETSVSFSATNGITLQNGSEGAFSTISPVATVTVADETARFALTSDDVSVGTVVYQTDTTAKYRVTDINSISTPAGWELIVWNREAAIEAEYLRALTGEEPYDSAIKSKRRVPLDVILDANYNESIKRAFSQLVINRGDSRFIMDAGLLYTVSQVLNWGETTKNIANPLIAKTVSNYKTKDPFTAKTINVTSTYYYAKELATHYKTFGSQVPFVGENYALLSGHLKNSVRPVIDADDLEVKDKLYTLKLNALEAVNENEYTIGTQETSQSVSSDLSEESNVQIMLEMKRIVENLVRPYSLAESEDRRRFTENVDRALQSFRVAKVADYTIDFQMNDWERERNILHCYLGITFLTINKTTIIEIDINKRTSAGE